MKSEVRQVRHALRRASGLEDVHAALVRLAPAVRADFMRSRLVGRRDELGLVVRSTEMGCSGMTVPDPAESLVLLRRSPDDNGVRRRWTLVHEFAHNLLDEVDSRRFDLSPEEEEATCDRFAVLVLLPSERVRTYLGAVGFPDKPEAVLRFSRAFKVSIFAAIRTLASQAPADASTALLLASWRAHPKRPEETDWRIDVSTHPMGAFIPRHRRLGSIGLHELRRWLGEAEPGSSLRADEGLVKLPSRTAGILKGPVTWSAFSLAPARGSQGAAEGRVGCVAAIDISRLELVQRKRLRLPTTPTRTLPGQLPLPEAA